MVLTSPQYGQDILHSSEQTLWNCFCRKRYACLRIFVLLYRVRIFWCLQHNII